MTRDRLREKLSRLNSEFDQEMMLAGLTLAGFHVEAGARRFIDYAKAMIEDLGPAARPRLAQWYIALRMEPGFDTTGMDTLSVVEVESARLMEAPAAPTPMSDELAMPARQILNELGAMRDDLAALTAITMRQDGTLARLLTEIRLITPAAPSPDPHSQTA